MLSLMGGRLGRDQRETPWLTCQSGLKVEGYILGFSGGSSFPSRRMVFNDPSGQRERKWKG